MVQQHARKTITDYKKAYEKLRTKVQTYEIRLKEKEHLLREYKKRLPKLEELTKLSRVTSSHTVKYRLYSESLYGQGAHSRKKRKQYIDEILESLAKTHPNGQSNLELTKSTRIPRWTVQRRCESLKEDGLVYQDRGKFGKYHLTELALGAPNMQGHWLEKIAYDSLISRYTLPNSTTKQKLSALVIALGLYSTYIMIQSSLDEDFHPYIGTKSSLVQKIKNILKSRQKHQRSKLVKARIEGAINPVQMFLQLCRLVIPKEELNRYISTTMNTPTTPPEYILTGLLFKEHKTAFRALKKAFTDLYPEDFRQLEGIRKEQAPNAAWSHLKAKYKRQKNGKYKPLSRLD